MPQSISAEPLAQMVRSITLQKRTGVLQVEQLGGRDAENGEIYFENGSLMRARTKHESGKAALQRIGEWKQITCSFQNISRPPQRVTTPIVPVLPRWKAEQTESREVVQTDPLAHTPAAHGTSMHEGRAGQQRLSGARTTRELNSRQAEATLSSGVQTAASQPLVVHGTTLEAYVPTPLTGSSRAVQRWTTHQVTETEASTSPRVTASASRPPAISGKDTLPGRMAIFKSRQMVSPAQAIQQMERRARLVFILLDGQRTVQDIARLIHQTEYDVEHILVDLTQRGYTCYVQG